jgi:SagB-type dehydrogenase family enzyme
MTCSLDETKGLEFYRASSMTRDTIRALKKVEVPDTTGFKKYADAVKVTLPRISWQLEEARLQPLLQQRRSLRRYSAEPIRLLDLAFMLWASQGVTAQAGKHMLRTSPSAGALYPVETYVSIQNVEDIAAGLYHFDPQSFQLEFIDKHFRAQKLAAACLDQSFISSGAVTFVWTAIAGRSMSKYGERGMRYVFLDAAHICQNVLMSAEALKCGGCPVAAFYDQELAELLGLDGILEFPVYAACVGKKM